MVKRSHFSGISAPAIVPSTTQPNRSPMCSSTPLAADQPRVRRILFHPLISRLCFTGTEAGGGFIAILAARIERCENRHVHASGQNR